MGLFNKLLGRGSGDQNKQNDVAKTEPGTSLIDQSSIEKAIAQRCEHISLDQCLKISLTDIATLGASFAKLLPSLRTISMDGIGYIPVNMGLGDVLKTAGNELFYGAHVTLEGASKFTKWAPISASNAIMPIDPVTIMMAVVLVSIEKKLDKIQETQMKILSFLEQDKQAEQQANLNILTDILIGYKHNWDNDQYLRNHHIKVLDIQQTAEKNIIFYQEQIASAIKTIPAIYVDQAVKNSSDKLEKLFGNYRMALYVFAFSSFLEVMLLGNLKEEYLNHVADKVRKHTEHYQIQFHQCCEMIKKLSKESIETMFIAGLGGVSKALGSWIASSPILNQGPVDEWLQEGGEKLLKENDAKVARSVSIFTKNEEAGSEVFIDSIKNVAMLRNRTTDLLFDGETLYLATL